MIYTFDNFHEAGEISCIYGIYCKPEDKWYIGQTQNLKQRLKYHKIGFCGNSHTNPYLNKISILYPLSEFEIHILMICDISELNREEKRFIEIFGTNYSNRGYNIQRYFKYSRKEKPTRKNVAKVVKKEKLPRKVKIEKVKEPYFHLVLNMQTGIYYESIREAAESVNMWNGTLNSWLTTHPQLNKTDFVLAERGKSRRYNPIILDVESGVFLESFSEAANHAGVGIDTIINWLTTHKHLNRTNLILT